MNHRFAVQTSILGLMTAAVLLTLQLLPEGRAAYPDGGASAALTRFQLADGPAALREVFGDPPNRRIVAAMDATNRVDLYLFIPVCGLFLLAGARMLTDGTTRRLFRVIAALTVVGIGGDVLETSTQLRITAHLPGADALMGALALGAWTKLFGFAAGAFGCSVACLAAPKRRWGPALAGLSPLPLAIASWFDPDRFAPFAISAAAGFWLALLVDAVQRLFVGSRQFATDPAPNPILIGRTKVTS